MVERDIVLTIDACLAVLDGRNITELGELKAVRERAEYTAPEIQRENWVLLCLFLDRKVRSGELPSPAAADAPAWVKWLSDVVEAKVIILRGKES